MRPVRTGFEFGMILHSQKERMVFQFDGLHQSSVRRKSGQYEPGVCQYSPVLIGEISPMAMPVTAEILYSTH